MIIAPCTFIVKTSFHNATSYVVILEVTTVLERLSRFQKVKILLPVLEIQCHLSIASILCIHTLYKYLHSCYDYQKLSQMIEKDDFSLA
jgi:hypothetical protein